MDNWQEKGPLDRQQLDNELKGLLGLQDKIKKLAEARSRRLFDLKFRIAEFGIPDDAKFAAAAILAGGTNRTMNELNRRLAYLEDLAIRVSSSPGQKVAWVESSPDRGHSRNYLYLGILEDQARIHVDEESGKCTIRAETGVYVPLEHGSPYHKHDNRASFNPSGFVAKTNWSVEAISHGPKHYNVSRWNHESPRPLRVGDGEVDVLIRDIRKPNRQPFTDALDLLSRSIEAN